VAWRTSYWIFSECLQAATCTSSSLDSQLYSFGFLSLSCGQCNSRNALECPVGLAVAFLLAYCLVPLSAFHPIISPHFRRQLDRPRGPECALSSGAQGFGPGIGSVYVSNCNTRRSLPSHRSGPFPGEESAEHERSRDSKTLWIVLSVGLVAAAVMGSMVAIAQGTSPERRAKSESGSPDLCAVATSRQVQV
jgi:hypothetical protein